jgi:quinol monooxygenase YgiN
MYGTVARVKAKPGAVEALLSSMEEDGNRPPGAVGLFVYQTDADPNELYMVAVFESKEAYFANAERPETHANYEKMMEWFTAEPEWHDGAVVYARQF